MLPSPPQRFNVFGLGGRDCPMCYRVDSLIGDGPRLECMGCSTVFALVARGTLERIPTPAPACTYREPVDMGCGICGRKHCGGHDQEQGVGR